MGFCNGFTGRPKSAAMGPRRTVCETLEIERDVVEAILTGDVDTIPHELLDFERTPVGLAEYF
jgi:hypothetical protein